MHVTRIRILGLLLKNKRLSVCEASCGEKCCFRFVKYESLVPVSAWDSSVFLNPGVSKRKLIVRFALSGPRKCVTWVLRVLPFFET